jgi:hypothetical protein
MKSICKLNGNFKQFYVHVIQLPDGDKWRGREIFEILKTQWTIFFKLDENFNATDQGEFIKNL